MDTQHLVDLVRQTGFEVHVFFKNGFLEKVYENALVNRLSKSGVMVQQQYPLSVHDEDGTVVGEYFADLWVDEHLIVELKVVRALDDVHAAQVFSYMKSAKVRHGMLMNFGAEKFEVRKFIL